MRIVEADYSEKRIYWATDYPVEVSNEIYDNLTRGDLYIVNVGSSAYYFTKIYRQW